jgi:hypothetical protein
VVSGRTGRTIGVVGAAVLLVLVVLGLARLVDSRNGRPFDFDLNWVAAHRLVDGEPLYDRIESRRDAVAMVSQAMDQSNDTPFESFIGAPVVALEHVPFAAFERSTAVELFRVASFAAMVAAVLVTSTLLSAKSRVLGAVAGLCALALLYPVASTLGIGQGNGFVLLALAVGMWAVVRERWVVAGIALGLAITMKLPIALLVVYLFARGRRRVALPAALTLAAATLLAALFGRANDLAVWVRDVFPDASRGSSYLANQSLPAWIERVTSQRSDFADHALLGSVQRLGPLLVLGGLAALVWWRRRDAMDPLELGAVVIVLLVAGPLSWDHYYAWVAVPLVLLCDRTRWAKRSTATTVLAGTAIAVALILLSRPVPFPSPRAIASDWLLRLSTGPYVLAGVLLMVAIVILLSCPPTASDTRDDEGAAIASGDRTFVRLGARNR